MGTMNWKVLTRNFPVHMGDTELEHICSGIGSNKKMSTPGDDLNQKDGTNNIPDIVSSIGETSQSQDSMEDCKDPDIVRSNSSSDEKSLEMQVTNHRAVFRAKVSDVGHSSVSSFSSSDGRAKVSDVGHSSVSSFSSSDGRAKVSDVGQSSVSSFSSSDGSKQGSSSSQGPDIMGKRSTADYLDKDLQQSKASTVRAGSWPVVFNNQDSVFAQESEDVPDGTVYYRPRQQAFSSRRIPSPIIESDPSLTSKEQDSNYSSRCSEKGQQARNRFSSSGYGTGSGDSSQGASASKISTQLSQGSFSKGDTATQRGVGSSTIGSDEPESAGSILHSKAASSNTTISNSGVGLHVNVTQSDFLKPAFQNANPDRRATSDASLSSNRMVTNHGLRNSFSVVADGPSISIESEHKQQNQQVHKHQIIMNINPHQIERQSSAGLQSVRQSQLNPAPQRLTHSQVGVKHIQAPTLPPNIEQFTAGFDPQRQLRIQNNGVIQTPQTGTTGTSLMSLRQPAAPVSNTSYDYPYLLRQQNPASSGSLNYNTAPMSASSSGSCYVPLSVEDRWTAEPSHVSLAKLLLQSGSVASESSGESRYHLDSLLKTDDQFQRVHPSGACHFPQLQSDNSHCSALAELYSESSTNDDLAEGNLWKKLEESVRCNETNCSDPQCAQIKADIAVLENETYHVQSLSGSLQNLLLAMFNHTAYVCDHPKCPFPWCGERIDNNHDLSRDEHLLIMKQRMENFAEHCRLLKSPVKYMNLKTSLPYNSMPEEDLHWMRLCMMGSSRRTLLVKPLLFNSCVPVSETGYWVIKKIHLTDEGDNWSVYSRLREVKHTSVVSLLWAASFEDHMLVCSMYEGLSLSDYLPCLPWSHSRFIPVFCIIQQLISAVKHVNSLGIVYLNWTSKNILVTYHSEMYFLIKLNNFSCSVLLEPPDGKRPCYDGGYLQLALPWNVVTPELKDDNKVEYVSDVWGIGCLLHELVTGYPIWHKHRHLDIVESLVGKKPQVPITCPELSEMFEACWQLEPSKRVPMSGLEIMLIQAFSHHLRS